MKSENRKVRTLVWEKIGEFVSTARTQEGGERMIASRACAASPIRTAEEIAR